MAAIRRVVTGHATTGKSIIASDEPVAGVGVPGLPGVYLTTLWGADQPLNYPDAGASPPRPDWFPPITGFRFIEFILAPDNTPPDTSKDAATLARESDRLYPGLMAHMQADDPGMHRSATTDMLYVVSGRCQLELDDGSKTTLVAGDMVVQSGTMHRWHNPFNEPCRVIGGLVGAHLKK